MQAVFKLCEHKKRKKKRRKRKEITTSLDSNPLLMVDLLQITSDGPVHSRTWAAGIVDSGQLQIKAWALVVAAQGVRQIKGPREEFTQATYTQSDITRRHLSPYSYNISAEGLTMS